MSLLLSVAPARAAGVESVERVERTARPLRFSVHANVLTGYPDLLGLSADVRMPNVPVQLQAGLWTFGLEGALYARLGYAFELADKREGDGSGWTHDMPLMLGFFSGDDLDGPSFHGGDLTLHFDNTYWIIPRLGVSTLITAGAGLWRNSDADSAAYGDLRLFPTLRLAVGLAF